MSVELRLPNINGATAEEKVEQLQKYLYQLVNELNFYLNLNKTSESTSDESLKRSLITKIEDAEGNFSELSQNVDIIESRVETNEGNISTLTQTATSLSTRVTTAEGNASTAMQTANYIKTEVYDSAGNSRITQNANNIDLKVTKGDCISDINLTSGSATISSEKININGVVSANRNFQIDTSGNMKIVGNGTEVFAGYGDANGLRVINGYNWMDVSYGAITRGSGSGIGSSYNIAMGSGSSTYIGDYNATLDIFGSADRPTYNGSDLALLSDCTGGGDTKANYLIGQQYSSIKYGDETTYWYNILDTDGNVISTQNNRLATTGWVLAKLKSLGLNV